jgi:hypothetical protein
MQYDTETVEDEQRMVIRCTGLETLGWSPLATNEGNACKIRQDSQKLERFLYANRGNATAQRMLVDTRKLYADMRSSLDKTNLEKRVGSLEVDIDETRDHVREQAVQRQTAIASIDAKVDKLTKVVKKEIGLLSSTVVSMAATLNEILMQMRKQ